jgi:hypothetical protein
MLQNNHLHKTNKISKEQSKEDIKKLFLGHQRKGIHGHYYSCNGYGHKYFECRSYERYIMEDFITPRGVGDAIK